MRFLIDTNPHKITPLVEKYPEYVAGQLIVPAAPRKNWGGVYGMDNSAYVMFHVQKFFKMLERNKQYSENCLFVTCPDVPGSARRTLELWNHYHHRIPACFPRALVSQDGIEDLDFPWAHIDVLFVGGGDPWKDSAASKDVVKTAKILEKHVHVGRVNQIGRYKVFSDLGADTCDGSSIAIHEYKLLKIIGEMESGKLQNNLFEENENENENEQCA